MLKSKNGFSTKRGLLRREVTTSSFLQSVQRAHAFVSVIINYHVLHHKVNLILVINRKFQLNGKPMTLKGFGFICKQIFQNSRDEFGNWEAWKRF